MHVAPLLGSFPLPWKVGRTRDSGPLSRCWWLAAGGWPLAADCCQLLGARCQLLAGSCQLPVASRQLMKKTIWAASQASQASQARQAQLGQPASQATQARQASLASLIVSSCDVLFVLTTPPLFLNFVCSSYGSARKPWQCHIVMQVP